MGVIRPPWISEDWFLKCPFNYCDHFGDKEALALVCRICREVPSFIADGTPLNEIYRLRYVPLVYAREKAEKKVTLTRRKLEELRKFYKSRPKEPDSTDPRAFWIYQLMDKYGEVVDRVIKHLRVVPKGTDVTLHEKAIDALAHSEHYVSAKIYRAISSKIEELRGRDYNIHDSKTSALFAYIAIDRNVRALLALANHRSLSHLKEVHVIFADISLEISNTIREHFFEDEPLAYEEIGCDSYNECFKITKLLPA